MARKLPVLQRVLETPSLAAVVMGLPQRVPGTSLFGKSLETVLTERPCRVIIESRPPARPKPSRVRERAKVAP